MSQKKHALTFRSRSKAAALKAKSGLARLWKGMSRFKKTLLVLFSILMGCVILAIAFISPLTRYLVEKYDVKYTGRQITMNWVYVNPFTGYVHIDKLKIYELQNDSLFFTADGVSANFSMLKMLSKNYEISELTLNRPRGIIIQNKKLLNFTDIIDRFSKKSTSTSKSVVHFSILSIRIVDGVFYYSELVTPINYFITKVNIESTGIHWDADTIAATFSFLSGIGSGGMKGNFTINFKTLDYRLAILVQKFDLNILEQYLNALTNYGAYTANLDADLKVKGSFKAAENVTFTGLLQINDFHIGKNPKDDYASFDKLALAIFELSPKNHKYLFDSVSLQNPYFKYERYDNSDNLEKMFAPKGANTTGSPESAGKFNLVITIGNYIKALSRNFFHSNYKVNRLAIYSGDLKYNDYSISEKFSMDFNPIYITADSVSKNHKRVQLFAKTGIQPFGNAVITLSINPNDSSDFDLQYHLQKIPVALFNPYIITYTSFPFDRGTLSLNGNWNVRNSIIQSNNHLLIVDPRVTNRIKNKDNSWVPARLIMALLRERSNVIDYEIPITGDLKDPKFHWRDVIFDILGNILFKPPTTTYGLHIKSLETEIEKSLTLKWEMRSSNLQPKQERFVERMANFLSENPAATIKISPQLYSVKEKEYIVYSLAKKKYFLKDNHEKKQFLNKNDSLLVEKMSVKDAGFLLWLNKQSNDKLLFTVLDKCNKVIGSTMVETKFNQLNNDRKRAFMTFFSKEGVSNQVKFTSGENVIPYNGFSFFKIDYRGEYPESLSRAYRIMNDLNNEKPRNLFKKERSKSKGIL